MEKLESLQEKLPLIADEIAQHIADTVAADIQTNWSANPPSDLNEAPAVVSGTLASSITVEMVAPAEMRVGSSAPYAAYLEFGTSDMAARPFLRPAVERVRGEIAQLAREVLAWMR